MEQQGGWLPTFAWDSREVIPGRGTEQKTTSQKEEVESVKSGGNHATQNGMRVIVIAHLTNDVQYMDVALPGNNIGPRCVSLPKNRWRRNTTYDM